MKRLRSQTFILLASLAVMAPALFFGGCGEPAPFEGEGGILDSPVSAAVNGKYVYITNANFDLSRDKQGWIAVLDTEKALVNRKTALVNRTFTEPYLGEILINSDKTIAYVANRQDDTVDLFDLSDPFRPEIIDLNPVADGDQGINVGLEPIGLALSPDESMLFVANVKSGDLSFVDTQSRRLIKNERLGSGINAVAVDPQGKYIYVSNKGINSISMIEVETGRFITSFSVGDTRSGLGQDTRGIAFSPDGRYAYIAAREPSSLMIVDTDKLPHYPDSAVIKFIPMDSRPSAVVISPEGDEIWVANYNSSNVFVVDANYHNILDVVDVGVGPYDIVFTEENRVDPGHYYAYVVNFLSHNVTLVDAGTKDVVWAIP